MSGVVQNPNILLQSKKIKCKPNFTVCRKRIYDTRLEYVGFCAISVTFWFIRIVIDMLRKLFPYAEVTNLWQSFAGSQLVSLHAASFMGVHENSFSCLTVRIQRTQYRGSDRPLSFSAIWFLPAVEKLVHEIFLRQIVWGWEPEFRPSYSILVDVLLESRLWEFIVLLWTYYTNAEGFSTLQEPCGLRTSKWYSERSFLFFGARTRFSRSILVYIKNDIPSTIFQLVYL